ncbi:MAG: SPFH domain-containing protein [Promethearchaeota archaeon]
MLFQEVNGWIVGGIVTVIIIAFLILIFMATRYRKFKTNQFVIHLRNGTVKHAGLGGSIWLLPLIDEFIVIPTTSIQTNLDAHEQVVSKEYQNISIFGMLIWKVIDPERAFSAVSWYPRDDNYVEKILKNAAEAIIRTTAANMEIEKIIRERREIIKQISKELHELTAEWGVVIESIEIREVNILEHELKENMEQVKKSIEARKARIARADAERESRLRELEVRNEVGIQEQVVEKEVAMQEKDREIAIAEKERDRKTIEADGERQKKVIEAEADAQQIKKKLIAQAEGEAENIKQQMLAQAEGFQKQVEAMTSADERFLAVQLTNILPEIFKNLSPEKMFIMGDGNESFTALSKAIMPFLQLLPEYSDQIKKFFGNGEMKKVLAKIQK